MECHRERLEETYYPGTNFEVTLDIGQCLGKCKNGNYCNREISQQQIKTPYGNQNIDIIKAMMPGGSVIGCPKISTLNLLNNQEKENRNIYTGSFGFIKFNGDMRFNIIIRSILNYKNISEISVASGVVIDSNAKHEFNENFIKAKALIDLFK